MNNKPISFRTWLYKVTWEKKILVCRLSRPCVKNGVSLTWVDGADLANAIVISTYCRMKEFKFKHNIQALSKFQKNIWSFVCNFVNWSTPSLDPSGKFPNMCKMYFRSLNNILKPHFSGKVSLRNIFHKIIFYPSVDG